jgi:hypothetical protein
MWPAGGAILTNYAQLAGAIMAAPQRLPRHPVPV